MRDVVGAVPYTLAWPFYQMKMTKRFMRDVEGAVPYTVHANRALNPNLSFFNFDLWGSCITYTKPSPCGAAGNTIDG